MYSWTISIAEILGGEDRLFGFFVSEKNGKKLGHRHKCFRRARTNDCRKQLTKIVSEIFRDAGYGQYDKSEEKANSLNLTTLLTKIIYYDNFDFSLAEVMKALDRNRKESEKFWKEYALQLIILLKKMVGKYSLVYNPNASHAVTEDVFWNKHYKGLYLDSRSNLYMVI